MGLTIKKVSERTGVSLQTLRAWERRYGVPRPVRQAGNRYRLYEEQDIADVLWMKQRVEAGVSPAQASAVLRRQTAAESTSPASGAEPLGSQLAALLSAFLKADQAAAQYVLDEAFALFRPEQVALQIIQPALVEVGQEWLRGNISVWHEHLATNLVRRKLTAIRQIQPPQPMSAPHVVAACAPEEEHEIGILIFALLAAHQGWRVSYLGPRTPLADLMEFARTTRPDLIAISVTTVIGLSNLLPLLQTKDRPEGTLAFGGRLPAMVPDLRVRLGGAYIGEELLANMRLLPAISAPTHRWTPSKRGYEAALAIEEKRFRVLADTAARSRALLRHPEAQGMTFGMMNLVDTLACALGFDVPELMDLQATWLKEFIVPRRIRAEWVDQSLGAFARSVEGSLSSDRGRLVLPLLDRLRAGIR